MHFIFWKCKLNSGISKKCWKLSYSISEKCWKFIASKMLEIKIRHLSWGGPYSIGKVWDKEQMSLHMLLYQILPTNINYQFDEIIAGLELEKWCVSVNTRLFHFEYWLGTLILVMGPAQKSQARLAGPWIWMLGSGHQYHLLHEEFGRYLLWETKS